MFSTQAVRVKHLQYLTSHPITNEADVSFVKREIMSLIDKAEALQQRQNRNSEATPPTLRWSGPAPYYRLLHAVTDIPDNKGAFMDSFRVSTREEIEGRHIPETARPNTWNMIATTFNNRTFRPTSNIYSDSHPDLAKSLDISYEAVVVKMGKLTGEKAKDKFMEMKNQGSVVVANYGRSGGGDGQRSNEERDFQQGNNDAPIVTMERNYSNCLKTYGTQVLYFLKHIVLHEVVAHSMQEID